MMEYIIGSISLSNFRVQNIGFTELPFLVGTVICSIFLKNFLSGTCQDD